MHFFFHTNEQYIRFLAIGPEPHSTPAFEMIPTTKPSTALRTHLTLINLGQNLMPVKKHHKKTPTSIQALMLWPPECVLGERNRILKERKRVKGFISWIDWNHYIARIRVPIATLAASNSNHRRADGTQLIELTRTALRIRRPFSVVQVRRRSQVGTYYNTSRKFDRREQESLDVQTNGVHKNSSRRRLQNIDGRATDEGRMLDKGR